MFEYNWCKIQIELNFINSDKATVIVFGDHNGSQFIVMITVWYIDMHCTIQNIIGSLGVASVSKTADGNIVLRCNTNKYGTCTVIASVPINYVIFAN